MKKTEKRIEAGRQAIEESPDNYPFEVPAGELGETIKKAYLFGVAVGVEIERRKREARNK